MLSEARTGVVTHLRLQARWCTGLGSPLYAGLLDSAARDVESQGVVWDVLRPYADRPPADAVPLRLMGAVHRLVLTGALPELARFYPSAGGELRADPWPAFRTAVEAEREAIGRLLDRGVQTNEVARSAALLGGFLLVACETELPLRLLEIGASAGLNLRWDHYRYEMPTRTWGDPGASLVLRGCFETDELPLDVRPEVVERRGCDRAPLDPSSANDRLTLMSYIWADQRERFVALGDALTVARQIPAPVEAANAADWLEERLSAPVVGAATVVFHSIVLQYLTAADRERVIAALHTAGARASRQAPLAYLRMEPGGAQTEVRLTIWPDGRERLVATSGFHGRGVRWLG